MAESMDIGHDVLSEIAEALDGVFDQSYQLAAARALDVLANPNPCRAAVERALDGMLDSAGMTDRGLAAFKFLCRYYLRKYPDLVASYVRIYKEIYEYDLPDEEE